MKEQKYRTGIEGTLRHEEKDIYFDRLHYLSMNRSFGDNSLSGWRDSDLGFLA